MQGMSKREYAIHSGLSRGAIQKAKRSSRMVHYADGLFNAAVSGAQRAGETDPGASLLALEDRAMLNFERPHCEKHES